MRAGDLLDGAYADLLWQLIERDTVPDCEQKWREHLRTAVADFRALVALLRAGGGTRDRLGDDCARAAGAAAGNRGERVAT